MDRVEPESPENSRWKNLKKINGFVFYATKYTSEALLFYISKKDVRRVNKIVIRAEDATEWNENCNILKL